MVKEQVDSAIELQDKAVLGSILAGLRDLAGKNILEAPIFRGQFNRKTVALLKQEGKTAAGFWTKVAEMLLDVPANKPILRKLPGIADATVRKYGPVNGQAGEFWKVGEAFRDAVERNDEDRLCRLLNAVDEALAGDISQCPWAACVAFYGLSAPYTDEIYDLLEAAGIDDVRSLDKADIWFVGDDSQYSRALARFILAHKEYWPAMCHDITCFILSTMGANGITQFVSFACND